MALSVDKIFFQGEFKKMQAGLVVEKTVILKNEPISRN